MSKNDKKTDFSDSNKGLNSSASIHEELASTTQRIFASNEIPRGIHVKTAGDLVMKDAEGTTVTYPVVVGETLPFMPTEITAASTASIIIWW